MDKLDEVTENFILAIKDDLETNKDDNDFHEGIAVGAASAARYFFHRYLGDDATSWMDELIDPEYINKKHNQ